DNAPTHAWYEELPDWQRQNLWTYFKPAQGKSDEAAPALMHLAWSSKAALAMAPLQDLLNLGADSRMNVPGRAGGNWRWLCPADKLSLPAFEWLQQLTAGTGRALPGVDLAYGSPAATHSGIRNQVYSSGNTEVLSLMSGGHSGGQERSPGGGRSSLFWIRSAGRISRSVYAQLRQGKTETARAAHCGQQFHTLTTLAWVQSSAPQRIFCDVGCHRRVRSMAP